MNIKLTIGDKNINSDGNNIKMDVAPFISNNRTFVPVRFISECLGKNVFWDDKKKEVTIYDRKVYFDTMNECAIDFYMYFNAMSIGIFREIGATIKYDSNGYYWDGVCIGKAKELPKYKLDFVGAVAILHTHGGCGGASNSIAPADKDLACKHNMPIYMCSPVGQCWVYDPNSDNKKSIMFYDGAPVDLRCLKQLEKEGYKNLEKNIARFNEYFKRYYDLDDQPLGHIADYYNKMFSKGEVYVLRIDADK